LILIATAFAAEFAHQSGRLHAAGSIFSSKFWTGRPGRRLLSNARPEGLDDAGRFDAADDAVGSQMPLSFSALRTQHVATIRLAMLRLAAGGHAKSLGNSLMCLLAGHCWTVTQA
jgi:hypothetical protein